MQNSDDDDPITYRPDPNRRHPSAASKTTINDVPVPLRATIVVLARKGMPATEIAARFGLPVEWVVLLYECPPGSMEH
jgi:DNA-directed RNA polymerase specialized sigma24 family protein